MSTMLSKLLGCTSAFIKKNIMVRVKLAKPSPMPIMNDESLKRNYTDTPITPGSAATSKSAGGKEHGAGFGMFGAAKEEEYFYNKSREEIDKIKKMLQSEQAAAKQKAEEPPKK